MQSFPQIPLQAGDNTGHFAQKFNALCERSNNGLQWLRWFNLSLKEAKETLLFEFPVGTQLYFPEPLLLHLPQGLGLSNPAEKVVVSLGFLGNKEEVLARSTLIDNSLVQKIPLTNNVLHLEQGALTFKVHQAQEQASAVNMYLPYFILN